MRTSLGHTIGIEWTRYVSVSVFQCIMNSLPLACFSLPRARMICAADTHVSCPCDIDSSTQADVQIDAPVSVHVHVCVCVCVCLPVCASTCTHIHSVLRRL